MDMDVFPTLRRAGAAALEFNAPLSSERADQLVAFAAAHGSTAVDLGCGRGALLLRLARAGLSGVGVDSDPSVIETARTHADELGLAARVSFEVADAGLWSEPADLAVCIGSSHTVGGTDPMFDGLAQLAEAAVVGDGVWMATPDPANAEQFGDLPHGLEALESQAESAGWLVADSALSTLDEWDAFEGRWIEGVRGVGTPAAHQFADQRWAAYQEYRGVLGFAWLCLTRPSLTE
ncbi:MAG: methyltransferase domain-containing protein [Actinomycetia bacterium]|nr:methyltransferase domain-containing protein [Actinomycetes bacterium]